MPAVLRPNTLVLLLAIFASSVAAQERPDSSRGIADGPANTRLFLFPTARTLREDAGRWSGHFILLPLLDVGVSDRLSLGAMVSMIPMVEPEDQIKAFIPRVALLRSSDVNVALGALVFEGFDHVGRVGYVAATRSGRRASITGGLGYGEGGEVVDQTAFLLLGGEFRFTPRLAIVTENWAMPGAEMRWRSWGFRLGGPRWQWDIAVVRTRGDQNEIASPLIGLTRNW
jgi:hypothetical protein